VTLRLRLTLVAAGVVAIVVAAASVTTYFLVRHDLRSQVDNGVKSAAGLIQHDPRTAFQTDALQLSGDIVQVVDGNGRPLDIGPAPGAIPVDAASRSVASARNHYLIRDTTIQGMRFREVVAPLHAPFGAVMVIRSLHDVNHELARLRLILILVSLGAVAMAALLGALASRRTLAPVLRLTAAAEHIAHTGDPSERVPDSGGGELARLGGAFNTMLGALEESLDTQRRFVADASHELRTPLTSMQTNIEVLKQQERLEPSQRAHLFADLEREAHEMRDLITGLLELARGDANLERRPGRERGRASADAVPAGRVGGDAATHHDRRRSRAPRARRLEPARERGQVDERRRRRRGRPP
jgi:two-component system, OmpR family, sensor histidine kinase MprB